MNTKTTAEILGFVR